MGWTRLGGAPRGGTSGRDPFVALAAAFVVLPCLAAALSALRNPWIPVDDWALIELEVRAVGTRDTPLVGAGSLSGAHHPGPLPFYVLALPYRLAPADRGLMFAAAVVNLGATLGFAAVMIRQARSRALVALAALAVLQFGLGADQLADPWNATLPILPFALYLALCHEMATRPDERWVVPVAVAVASFVLQAHVSFAGPVVLAGMAALGLRWWNRREMRVDDDRPAVASLRSWRRIASPSLLVPIAVGLLAWLPPLIDQVWGEGNLGTLVQTGLGTRAETGGLNDDLLSNDRVLDGVAWLLEPVGMWTGQLPSRQAMLYPVLGASSPIKLLWLVVVFGGVVLAAHRHRLAPETRRSLVSAGVVAAAGVVATFVVVARARGAAIEDDTVILWPFRWAAAVVMFIWIAAGWALASLASHRVTVIDGAAERLRNEWRSGAMGTLLTLGVALPVVATVWGGTLGRQPLEEVSRPFLRLQPDIERLAGQEDLVVANGTIRPAYVDLGLAVVLDRAGIEWVERYDPRAGEHWRYTVAPVDSLDGGPVRLAIERGTAEVVARSGPPLEGEPDDSELVLLRSSRRATGILTGDIRSW